MEIYAQSGDEASEYYPWRAKIGLSLDKKLSNKLFQQLSVTILLQMFDFTSYTCTWFSKV